MKKQSRSLSEKFVPDRYQTVTIKRMLQYPVQAVFSDPGFGKTMCALTSFEILQKKGFVNRLFVISKRRIIHKVWPGEIFKWGMPLTYDILHDNKDKDELFFESDSNVQLINFESLDWLYGIWRKNKRLVNELFSGFMVVVDESTRIKNTNTQRFRMLRGLAPKFERRYIMTGTPTPRSLVDIWAQIWFLDFGKSLGNKSRFKNEFFNPCGYMGYDLAPIENAEEMIYKRISHLVVRFSEDLLDLPPVVIRKRVVTLPTEAGKIYDSMEAEFIAELRSGVVTASNAAVKSGKLRQIASGGVYSKEDGEDRVYNFIHHEKTEDLVDLIEELNGKPLIIAYEYHHDLQRMQEYLKDLETISGVSDKKADHLIDKWNRGELLYLAGHYESISMGLNLQDIDAAIACYTPTFNLELFDQLIRRLKRRGSKSSRIFIYLIVAKSTIDEVVLKAVDRKATTQKKFLSFIEDYYMPKKESKNMVSKVVEDRVNAVMDTAKLCKFKLPKWNGDADKFIRDWRGILSTFTNEQHCTFVKRVLGEPHKPATKKKEVESQKSLLMSKSLEALKEVFRYEVDEKTGKYVIADHIFTVLYPTTFSKKGEDIMSKFSAPSKGKKKATSKKKAGKKSKFSADDVIESTGVEEEEEEEESGEDLPPKNRKKKGRRFSSKKKVASKKKTGKKKATEEVKAEPAKKKTRSKSTSGKVAENSSYKILKEFSGRGSRLELFSMLQKGKGKTEKYLALAEDADYTIGRAKSFMKFMSDEGYIKIS